MIEYYSWPAYSELFLNIELLLFSFNNCIYEHIASKYAKGLQQTLPLKWNFNIIF